MSLEREITALRAELVGFRAEREVRAVVMRYFRLCDTLGPDTSLDDLGCCFTRNAIWEGRGRYRKAFGLHEGRAAIVAMLASYAAPQPHFAMNAHFLSTETIDLDGAASATGRWSMLQTSTYRDGRSDLRAAALTIQCVIEGGAWRIAHFITENLFARDVDYWSDATPISVPDSSSKEIFMSSADYAALVREDRILTPMYTDAAIFDEEMDRIFRNTWIWVAHVSDVPTPNSFKTSHVGREPVIVTRDKQGNIHTLLNRCRHRAASVCEKKKGKASVFVCPYHGWSYDPDGRLRKVPHQAGYGDGLDTAELGLVALRTEIYAGMVFATFNADVEPLVDFLGPARKWMDLFMKQGGGYGVKTLGEHRFRFPGNWKIQLENTTDAYHFPIVHKTFLDSLDAESENVFDVLGQGGWVEDLGNGHSVMVMIPDLIDLDDNLDAPIPQRFEALAAELVAEGMDDDQVRRVIRAVGGSGFNLNLFPNVACSMAFFRVLRPIGVDETEITHVAIGMDGGPPAANRMRLRLHEHFQGPMGFGTPDDAEGWERVQRGARAGGDLWIMVNRGVDAPEGVAAPGHNAGDVSAETGMRAAYQMWKRMMDA